MKKAFTLIELLIVIVTIGILAAFGTANFSKSIGKARARDAINNLSIIHAANMMYHARNGQNCTMDSVCTDIGEINNMNGTKSLNVIAGPSVYTCVDNGVVCTATNTDFTVTVKLNDPIVQGVNPLCSGSVCP